MCSEIGILEIIFLVFQRANFSTLVRIRSPATVQRVFQTLLLWTELVSHQFILKSNSDFQDVKIDLTGNKTIADIIS